MNNNYNKTICTCLSAAVVQAIIVNFAPMLFLTFQSSYGISFSAISLLISLNFGIQLTVDLLSTRLIDKIGYRCSILISQSCCSVGLVSMAFLPMIMHPYAGLVISTAVYAVGGGIIEVLVSPIVEACPTKNKEGTMSLLHSFYCWGHVFVVIFTTIFFGAFDTENWQILSCLWAILPAMNFIAFTRVPIPTLGSNDEKGLSIGSLFRNGLFWFLFLMMLCSGASEQSVIQWASAFAEKSLGVSKSMGDLAGPLSFAVLMGLSRALYAKFSEKINLEKFMVFSTILCITSYLLAALSNNPLFSFTGLALCGFSVGIMWPGTLSIGAASIKGGGTAMFALFALAGDVGCSVGPSLVGFVTDLSGNMKAGILSGIIFPLLLILALTVKKIKSSS